MIKIRQGNIFTTKCKTIVNTVNCVGVMGAGIAFEFKLRYPEMFEKYKNFCDNKSIAIGKLWLYELKKKYNENYQSILNFPTKDNWKYPTKIEYLKKGLQKLLDTYKEQKISSIAFPLLGASKGGLDEEESLRIMKEYLEQLDIDVEIWHFDPKAKDDLYEEFKNKLENLDINSIKEQSGLKENFITKIKDALKNPNINSLSALSRVKGIGSVSLEKSLKFIQNKN